MSNPLTPNYDGNDYHEHLTHPPTAPKMVDVSGPLVSEEGALSQTVRIAVETAVKLHSGEACTIQVTLPDTLAPHQFAAKLMQNINDNQNLGFICTGVASRKDSSMVTFVFVKK